MNDRNLPNIAALMIPYDFLDKVFLTHLHTDHWGDLSTIWAGGWTVGRTKPLSIWGPTGATPDMGTAYAIEKFLEAYNWDAKTRNFVLNPDPGKISVTEFDYKAVKAPRNDDERRGVSRHEFLESTGLTTLALGAGTLVGTSTMAMAAQNPAKAAGPAGEGPYNILFILTDRGTPWSLAVNFVNPHDVMFYNTDALGQNVQSTPDGLR